MNYRKIAPILLAALILTTASAHASVFRWTFSASITQLTGDDIITSELQDAGVLPGTQICGVIDFDSNATDVTPSPDLGYYQGAILRSDISVGGSSVTLDQQSFYRNMAVTNDEYDSVEAIADIVYEGLDHLAPAFVLVLFDSSGSIFDSEQMPQSGYSLNDFDPYDPAVAFPFTTGFNLFFYNGQDSGQARAALTGFSVAVVPLPPSALLLLTGLVPLLRFRRH